MLIIKNNHDLILKDIEAHPDVFCATSGELQCHCFKRSLSKSDEVFLSNGV